MHVHVHDAPLRAKHMLMCFAHSCVHVSFACSRAANTHMHAGGMSVWVCCVCTHMQAGLACRVCKVYCGCVHPMRSSGALSPREVWGCKGDCSPLPSLTCPGHRLHRNPSFSECQERNLCFFIPPEHPSLGPLEGRQHPAQPE